MCGHTAPPAHHHFHGRPSPNRVSERRGSWQYWHLECASAQLLRQLRENIAALFKITELIEAGAGG
ncbi:hypothetical protein LBW90_09800 [Pantoea rwandensis]|nr:hypothetical protein [Pantoea sp. alder69]MCA1250844.1 hypothetical protein [Pantoea sp. alder70]MCA1265257.1 hypothetical protein [Pantoea sp. alder81]